MLGGRGKNKAKVDPKSVTKFSEGKTDVPKRKRKQKEKPGGKSGKVESFKPDPRVVAEVNKIKKSNPNVRVRWNRDGSADIKNN